MLSENEEVLLKTMKAMRSLDFGSLTKFRYNKDAKKFSSYLLFDEVLKEGELVEIWQEIESLSHLRVLEQTIFEFKAKSKESADAYNYTANIPFVAAERMRGEKSMSVNHRDHDVEFESLEMFKVYDHTPITEVTLEPSEIDSGMLLLDGLKVVGLISDEASTYWSWQDYNYDYRTHKFLPAEPRFNLTADCSDFFEWGTADSEKVTRENIHLLEDSLNLVESTLVEPVTENETVGLTAKLFAAMVRRQRPQGAAYKHIPEELWSLFDAQGEERQKDYLNPHAPVGLESE